MDYTDVDLWFPLISLFCGLFLQTALLQPGMARKLAQFHPLPGSLRRIDHMSWVLIIVGALWEIQNLLV
jgi:hypothetical protein